MRKIDHTTRVHATQKSNRKRIRKYGSYEFAAPFKRIEHMRADHLPGDPQQNTRPAWLDDPTRTPHGPVGLLVRLYYGAGLNVGKLEDLCERCQLLPDPRAKELQQRILEDLAKVRGTPWMSDEPRRRMHGSAYGNSR